MSDEKKFELAEVIRLLRDELLKVNEASKEKPIMKFEECEIEFAVEISGETSLGAKLYFLTLGGKLKKSDANTVRLKFKALDKINGMLAPQGDLMTPADPPVRQRKPKSKR